MRPSTEIAVDFDGTCVTHDFPNVGQNIGATAVLRDLVRAGHKLILYTMRSGIHLESAVQWFLTNDISLYGIQYNPEQTKWTSSNKCYAQLYIDDAALGCPLLFTKEEEGGHLRPYVDWQKVREYLINNQYLPQ